MSTTRIKAGTYLPGSIQKDGKKSIIQCYIILNDNQKKYSFIGGGITLHPHEKKLLETLGCTDFDKENLRCNNKQHLSQTIIQLHKTLTPQRGKKALIQEIKEEAQQITALPKYKKNILFYKTITQQTHTYFTYKLYYLLSTKASQEFLITTGNNVPIRLTHNMIEKGEYNGLPLSSNVHQTYQDFIQSGMIKRKKKKRHTLHAN